MPFNFDLLISKCVEFFPLLAVHRWIHLCEEKDRVIMSLAVTLADMYHATWAFERPLLLTFDLLI